MHNKEVYDLAKDARLSHYPQRLNDNPLNKRSDSPKRNFYKTTVFGEVANTDYEGEINKQGDSVVIRQNPTITVNAYELGGTLTYEVPTAASLDLLIDKAYAWAFQVADIDDAQADVDIMGMASQDAAEQLRIKIDVEVLSYLYNQGHASNMGSAAGAITSAINLGTSGTQVTAVPSGVLDMLVDWNQVLDENDVGPENRWVILPAWMCAMLKKGDLKRADVTGDDTGVVRTGLIGMVDRFKIYQSNNVYSTSGTSGGFFIPFGTNEALTFASQLVKTESLMIPSAFGTYFRGLHVYGRKVVQPKALGIALVVKG